MTGQRAELIAEIQALYRRLHQDAVLPADLLALKDVRAATNEVLVEVIYRNRAKFERRFADFAPTYDFFRVLAADQIVVDVGLIGATARSRCGTRDVHPRSSRSRRCQ